MKTPNLRFIHFSINSPLFQTESVQTALTMQCISNNVKETVAWLALVLLTFYLHTNYYESRMYFHIFLDTVCSGFDTLM